MYINHECFFFCSLHFGAVSVMRVQQTPQTHTHSESMYLSSASLWTICVMFWLLLLVLRCSPCFDLVRLCRRCRCCDFGFCLFATTQQNNKPFKTTGEQQQQQKKMMEYNADTFFFDLGKIIGIKVYLVAIVNISARNYTRTNTAKSPPLHIELLITT